MIDLPPDCDVSKRRKEHLARMNSEAGLFLKFVETPNSMICLFALFEPQNHNQNINLQSVDVVLGIRTRGTGTVSAN